MIRLEEKNISKRNISNIKLSNNKRCNKLVIILSIEFFNSCFRNLDLDIRAEKYTYNNIAPSKCGDLIRKNKIINNRSIKKSNFLNIKRNTETHNYRNTGIQAFTKEKKLIDFYPLTEEDCIELQSRSGRPFTKTAMNEILQSLARKAKQVIFWSKKGFMAYMTKVYEHEPRDAEKTSSETFKILIRPLNVAL